MAPVTLAAVAAHFGRELDRCVVKMLGIIDAAAQENVDLLVFPDACLGGYIGDFRSPDPDDPPSALDPDGPEVAAIIAAAGAMTVCVGYAEAAPGGGRYNAVICVTGDGVLGSYRKVHQPAGESLTYLAGDEFSTFDTPVGRMGLLIDYDKTFPEAARALATDGAHIISALSAWPASVTDRASRLPADRQSRLFDLYDCARAAENQVVLVSSNQTGVMGNLRFLGQAKVVGPLRSRRGIEAASKGVQAMVPPDIDTDRVEQVLITGLSHDFTINNLVVRRINSIKSIRPDRL